MADRDWQTDVVSGAAVLLALLLAAATGVGGYLIGRHGTEKTTAAATTAATPSPAAAAIDPSVAAGAHDFVAFACAQCHGPQGRGGVSADVPGLSGAGKELTPAQLRKIIDHGLGESKNPTKPYMPVWGAVVSDTQV